jgi:hypothetical protein
VGAVADQRGALIGTVVSGVAGGAWAVWGASGLPTAAAAVVAVLGLLAALAIVVGALRAMRGAGRGGGTTMFRTRAYRLTVAVEIVACVAGAAVLGGVGLGEYVVVWIAAVVGAHFLVFGYWFRAFFYGVGAALLVAAVLGAVTGLEGAGPHAVVGVTGTLSALTLLGAGVLGLRRVRHEPAR